MQKAPRQQGVLRDAPSAMAEAWRPTQGRTAEQTRNRSLHPARMPRSANNGGGVYCSRHYSRKRRTGDPDVKTLRVNKTSQPCIIPGCDKLQRGRGYCANHWGQWKRRGDPLAPDRRPPRWTEKELAHVFAILDRAPDGLGRAEEGELKYLALLIGRTVPAVQRQLSSQRKKRADAQKARIVAERRAA